MVGSARIGTGIPVAGPKAVERQMLEPWPEVGSGPFAVVAENLSKRYANIVAVDRINLRIPEGQIFGLIGPNGSGKTTTIHMLAGLMRPTGGVAKVAGYDVHKQPVAVRRNIGLVFQEPALDRNLTVQENLEFAGALHKMAPRLLNERISELLRLFGLENHRDVTVGKLSGGMRRALDVARGVLHRPRVLFLDEPTVGLDPTNRESLWQFLQRLRQEENITVLVTTHYLEEAKACDRVAFLKRGRVICQGTPGELVASLGSYVLEVEGAHPETIAKHLESCFGRGLTIGTKVLFAINDENFTLDQAARQLNRDVQATHLRRPNLQDVYWWLIHGYADKES